MVAIEEILSNNVEGYFNEHIKYLTQDKIVTNEDDIEYFKSNDYRNVIVNHMVRENDKHHLIYFIENGKRIGASSFCIYKTEDSKCFILDFWLFNKYRGNGKGHECYKILEDYCKYLGASYFELNSNKTESIKFWLSNGYVENGYDEWNVPLFIKKSSKLRNKILASKRLKLMPILKNNMDELIDLLLNKEIKKTYMIPDFNTREEANPLAERIALYSNLMNHYLYGIFLNGLLIGFINDVETKNKTIELGYVINPKYKGNGYATEALGTVINELYRLDFNEIVAAFFEGNIASQRVMEKNGMVPSGVIEKIEYKNNTFKCIYYKKMKKN